MPHLNTRNLRRAREFVRDQGGWILDLGDRHYLATDDEGTVRDIRDSAFIAGCEAHKCWDETKACFSREDL